MNNFQDKANFIWQVADDIRRGAFKAHEYRDAILPVKIGPLPLCSPNPVHYSIEKGIQ